MNIKEATLRLQLLDGATGPARGITKALEGLDTRIARFDGAIRKTRWQLLDASAAFAAGAAALSFPVRQAIAFESAMADVRKVVDFESPAAFQQMSDDVIELTKRLPMTAEGIAQIVAAAGQSGLAQNELLGFADVAAKVGVAWDVTADEAGEALAKLKTSLGRTVPETALLADALNHLSNNTAASAPDLLNFTRRVAPMAAAFGMSAEQAAALGSAMVGSGFEAEVAATSFLNMGRALTAGGGATKRQIIAMASLGLNAKKVALGMQRDSVGTIQAVFDRLRKAPEHLRASLITDIFGAEARALTPLILNAGLLSDSLKLIGDSSQYAGSAQAEFESRSKTTANTLQLLRNRVSAVGITFGNALLPALNDAAGALGPLVDSAGAFVKANPALVRNMTLAGGALMGLRVAGLAGKLGMLMVSREALKLARPVLVVAGAVTRAGTAVAAFSTARMVAALAASGKALRTFAVAASLSGVGPAAAAALGTIGRGALGLLNPLRLLTGAVTTLKWATRGLLVATGVGAALVGLGAAFDWTWKNATNLRIAFSSLKDAFLTGIGPLRDDPTFKRLAGDAGELLAGIRRLTSEGDPSAFAAAGASAGRTLAEAFRSAADVLDRVVAGVKYLRAELAGLSEFQQSLNQIGLNIGKSTGLDQVGPWLKRQVGLAGTASAPGDKTTAERLGLNIGVEMPELDLKAAAATLPPIKPVFDVAGFEGAARLAGEDAGIVLGAGVADALKGQQPHVLGDFGSILSGLRAAAAGGIVVPVRMSTPSMVGLPAPSIAAAGPVARPAKLDGARERGGPVSAGGLYLVGERGPELFQPDTSGTVIPNNETPRALGGAAPAPRPAPALRIATAAAALTLPALAAAAPAPARPAVPVTAGAIYRAAALGEPLPTSRPASATAVERRVMERPQAPPQANVAAPVVPAPQVTAAAPDVSAPVVNVAAPGQTPAPSPTVAPAAPARREPPAPAPVTNNIHAPITLNVQVKAGDGTSGADIAAQVEKAARKALNDALGSIDRAMLRRPQVSYGGTLYGDF